MPGTVKTTGTVESWGCFALWYALQDSQPRAPSKLLLSPNGKHSLRIGQRCPEDDETAEDVDELYTSSPRVYEPQYSFHVRTEGVTRCG